MAYIEFFLNQNSSYNGQDSVTKATKMGQGSYIDAPCKAIEQTSSLKYAVAN